MELLTVDSEGVKTVAAIFKPGWCKQTGGVAQLSSKRPLMLNETETPSNTVYMFSWYTVN